MKTFSSRLISKARDQVISQMNGERKEYITQLKEMSFQLGEAQANFK
jgi:hypothetical protein